MKVFWDDSLIESKILATMFYSKIVKSVKKIECIPFSTLFLLLCCTALNLIIIFTYLDERVEYHKKTSNLEMFCYYFQKKYNSIFHHLSHFIE